MGASKFRLSQFTKEILQTGNFYVVSCIFLLIMNGSSFAQWTNQNPVTDGNHLRAVFFINDSTGWMAGSDGYIAKTTNYGEEWVRQNSGTSAYLKAIKFIDENLGFAVGSDGVILKTTNGGINWTVSTYFNTIDFNSIDFSSRFILIAGDAGIVLRSDDLGLSWNSYKIKTDYSLTEVKFVNGSTGWISCLGDENNFYPDTTFIFKTTDGGLNWESLSFTSLNGEGIHLYSIEFVDEKTGWAAGGSGIGGFGWNFKIINTTDGGESWYLQDCATNTNTAYVNNRQTEASEGKGGIRDLLFTDNRTGYAVGGVNTWEQIVLKTTDGGINWNKVSFSMEDFDLYALHINSNGKGLAVGGAGTILKSFDQGQNWIRSFSGSGMLSGDDIESIAFVDSKIGYAAGYRDTWQSGGVILKTTNGGRSWFTNSNYRNGMGFESISFVNENTGWVLSEYDGILSTTDGGINWNWNYLPLIGSSVVFLNEQVGLIGGDKIYKSYDGGINWTEKSNYQSNSVYFIDENTGWSCGNSGTILLTTDGGENWIPKVSGTNAALRSVKFYNNLLGICVGDNGVIVLTYDGGESWVSKPNGINADLRSAAFADDKNIWITGENGTLISTTDAGDYWTTNYSLTSKDLNTVFFIDQNSGWIGGNDGTIFKYDYESVVPVELVSFTAEALNGMILLNWQTASEVNNAGFEIERNTPLNPLSRGDAEGRGVWEKIGFVNGVGTTSDLQSYTYTDENLIPGKYRYRLKQIDLDGSFEYSNEIEVVIATPEEFILEQNYPNPFNPSTSIQYAITNSQHVQLKVYDILGNEIATLVDEYRDAGAYQVEFNSDNLPTGRQGLASGTYFYRLQTGSFVVTKKMVLLR